LVSTYKPKEVTGCNIPYDAGPAKVMDNRPREYRLAKTHTGDLVLQGAYYWSCGMNSGFEWKTIPTVDLNEKGEES